MTAFKTLITCRYQVVPLQLTKPAEQNSPCLKPQLPSYCWSLALRDMASFRNQFLAAYVVVMIPEIIC